MPPSRSDLPRASKGVSRLGKQVSKYHFRGYPDCLSMIVAKSFQLLSVHLLKCAGYDEAFQQEINEKIQAWVPPPPPEKKGSKGKESTEGHGTGKLKRKRSEEETTDGSDGEVSRTDDEEEEEAGHLCSKGHEKSSQDLTSGLKR